MTSAKQKLTNLADRLASDVDNLTDQEILDEAAEDGESIGSIQKRARASIEGILKKYQRTGSP